MLSMEHDRMTSDEKRTALTRCHQLKLPRLLGSLNPATIHLQDTKQNTKSQKVRKGKRKRMHAARLSDFSRHFDFSRLFDFWRFLDTSHMPCASTTV